MCLLCSFFMPSLKLWQTKLDRKETKKSKFIFIPCTCKKEWFCSLAQRARPLGCSAGPCSGPLHTNLLAGNTAKEIGQSSNPFDDF
ncbi:MAG: hypothetical protein H7296_12240 [Bacteroidia bacterium]|nr:hypothetical protein [Bacteroidia bacterium]